MNKKIVALLTCLLLSIFVSANEIEKKIVGKWRTDIIISQVGRIVLWQEFKSDGTFHLTMDYIDMDLPDDEQSGIYKIKDDKLTTVSKTKTHTSRLYFDGDDLMIDDGGNEVFRYTRINNLQDGIKGTFVPQNEQK